MPPSHSPVDSQPNSANIIAENPWKWWRDQMPIATSWAYFDHAAVAPLSDPARRWLVKFANEAAELGDTVWPTWAAKSDELRRGTAELLACDSREICVVFNTTAGINLVAEGFPWQPGDSVVIPDGEFPSNLFPWLNQRSRGVDVRIVPRGPAGEVKVDDLLSRVDESTRMIAVSWVGFASGYRLDIERLVQQAHDRGVLVFLDAIQGLGIYDLNLKNIPVDFLAADGHKWLLGPEGAGIAMIRQVHLGRLRIGSVGWGSVKNSYNYNEPQFDLKDDASRYESGSANMAGIGALVESLNLFLQVRRVHGPDAIGDRVIERATRTAEMLSGVGAQCTLPEPGHRSGIVTFSVPGIDPAKIRQRCIDEKVVVSCRGGGVRASVHAYNSDDDLQRLVDAVKASAMDD